MLHAQRKRHGFTLIEISIILTIIGLVISGMFVGKTLMETAAIRTQIKQLEKLSLAHNAFKLKYRAVAGDICTSASDMGLECGNPAGTRDNGYIEDMLGMGNIHNSPYEPLYFFGHLIDAGLLEKNMVCEEIIAGYPTYGHYALTLNPSGSMLAFTYESSIWLFLGVNQGLIPAGCDFNAVGTISTAGILTPAQSEDIDIKLDDGIPSKGALRATMLTGASNAEGAVDNVAGECVVDATSLEYNTSNTGKTCKLMYKL